MDSEQRLGTPHTQPAPPPRPAASSLAQPAEVQTRIGQHELVLMLLPYDVDSPAARDYVRLQTQTYAAHGVTSARRVSDGSMRSCSHLLLARELGGRLLGGLRLHDSRLGNLPIEAALPGSASLAALLTTLADVVEPSGMVVHAEARKSGLSALLVRGAVAAAPLLGAQAALGLGHQHVMPLYARFGFVPEESCGCHAYPDARYQSRVAVLRDVDGLESVARGERHCILAVRRRLGTCTGALAFPFAGAVP
jgi:predicted GNAT family N-acyltransferase